MEKLADSGYGWKRSARGGTLNTYGNRVTAQVTVKEYILSEFGLQSVVLRRASAGVPHGMICFANGVVSKKVKIQVKAVAAKSGGGGRL